MIKLQKHSLTFRARLALGGVLCLAGVLSAPLNAAPAPGVDGKRLRQILYVENRLIFRDLYRLTNAGQQEYQFKNGLRLSLPTGGEWITLAVNGQAVDPKALAVGDGNTVAIPAKIPPGGQFFIEGILAVKKEAGQSVKVSEKIHHPFLREQRFYWQDPGLGLSSPYLAGKPAEASFMGQAGYIRADLKLPAGKKALVYRISGGKALPKDDFIAAMNPESAGNGGGAGRLPGSGQPVDPRTVSIEFGHLNRSTVVWLSVTLTMVLLFGLYLLDKLDLRPRPFMKGRSQSREES